MKQYFITLLAGVAILSGCAGESTSGSPEMENIQIRLDTLSNLQEIFDLEELGQNVPSQISELADRLTDSESDKESLIALCKKLKKSAKDKEEMKVIVSDMAKLINVPEKFNEHIPLKK
ncbi:MAG: hypothetical protein HOK57_12980 [Planctomycetaceae bacterium]|jgi:hypothetical protein|nr:hypothetical protein [Planctomycetaceae bacterium]MBT4158354.1 hypothetical protein [Planctomycetaceae bacterium]MBT6460710.1 hypothetical protein [Planctomycetaceae bacterium]MBT6642976.1 hypothetical protein [Planctomycetaceae bacterium]MBT6919984.1 hypothetical protein [Planctomycetaceae bacterium]